LRDAAKNSARSVKLNAILLSASAVVLALLYAPVAAGLVRQWLADENYRHGLLIPFVSGLLLWRKREELSGAAGGKETFGLLIMAAAAALLIMGTAAAELFTMRTSLPLMLIGASLYIKGAGFTLIAAPALALLQLMVPLPNIIYYKVTFPMQLLSARLSSGVLSALKISVIRKGNILILPNYTLEVIAACSGLRSLMTMFTLAAVIALLMDISVPRKIALLLVSLPAAIAANTIRLVVTGMGAYLIDPGFADGPLHSASGMIVFLAGLLMILSCAWILRWTQYRRRRS
jgi:exosortase